MEGRHPTFAHRTERALACILDQHGIAWDYEPHTFVLARSVPQLHVLSSRLSPWTHPAAEPWAVAPAAGTIQYDGSRAPCAPNVAPRRRREGLADAAQG
jgi:hypothetical protein